MYRGRIVGESDKLGTWHKPKKCPQGLSEDAFAALPSTLVVREIYYYIIIPGFRTTSVSLITTLLDTEIYPTLELVRLYDLRWDVEVDLKHLKSTLGMDVLRCKTPLMVRKELYVYLLAYNLLRTLGGFYQRDYQSNRSDEDVPFGQQWISFQPSLDQSHCFFCE
jgi:hypothetical protein